MMTSTVKWFNDMKGFGFINYTENEDVFVHYTQIQGDGFKTLSEGDKVKFDLVNTDKGYQALKVVKEV